MSKFPVTDATVQRWLLDGPLAAYVPTYLQRLRQGCYSERTIKHKLHAVAHVCRRRLSSEPPCRLNTEPGAEAGSVLRGCGQV